MDESTRNKLIGALAIVVAALISIIPNFCRKTDTPPPQMSGQIESPQSGNIVENVFNIKGKIANIPKDHYVWLAVKIDDNIWPKKQIQKYDYSWSTTIEEYGESKQFNIILMVVNTTDHQKIIEWLKRRGKEQKWRPIDGINERIILDDIQLTSQK